MVLIKNKLSEDARIKSVEIDFKQNTAEIDGDFDGENSAEIADDLTKLVHQSGYGLTVDKVQKKVNWAEFKTAIPLAIIVITIFAWLQKSGLINVDPSDMNYTTAFIIGIVASISTCLAVVGGFILSLSANFAKEGDDFKPHLLFHIGRLGGFFVLGGVIGLLGAAFHLNFTFSLVLSSITALVMLVLGVNLLDIFDLSKKWQAVLPHNFSRHIVNLAQVKHSLVPVLLGAATFFLPCGFTQSMQIYALSLGDFWKSATFMLAFSLGTLPVLSAISFGAFKVGEQKNAGMFFKAAGILVIFMAIFNLLNTLAAAGIIAPVVNF